MRRPVFALVFLALGRAVLAQDEGLPLPPRPGARAERATSVRISGKLIGKERPGIVNVLGGEESAAEPRRETGGTGVPVYAWQHGGGWSRTTRADGGVFELEVPPGDYNVAVNKEDQEEHVSWFSSTGQDNVRVGAGETVPLEFELEVVGPRAVLLDAAPIELPKVDTDPGRNADSNSPAHWVGDKLYVFESAFAAYRSSGSGIDSLEGTTPVTFDNPFGLRGGRWIEATYKSQAGRLYGWYHHEPTFDGTNLTAPKIGAAWSDDEGATWHDLGIVLEAPPGTIDRDAKNGYFMGGHGDFSVIRQGDHFYFLFTNYSGGSQGVSIARMPLDRLANPRGAVTKWHEGDWSQPGVGGAVTPIFEAKRSWSESDPDSFWGPSVHWNSHLEKFVVLMNRTRGGAGDWKQEGVYVTFNEDLSRPGDWTRPTKIIDGGSWYPQVLGTAKGEADKEAGGTARLFVAGKSRHEISFKKPGE